jgi:hypothetical protein
VKIIAESGKANRRKRREAINYAGQKQQAEGLARQRQRQQQYGTPLTYNIPSEARTKLYGNAARLRQSGVSFKNPDNLPIPKELRETIYSAMLKVPYFAQHLQKGGKEGGEIEFVLGSSKNHAGTYFNITIPDTYQGGETKGVYQKHAPFKPSMHIVIPEKMFREYEQGMANAARGKAQGSKHWKKFEQTAVQSFRERANDVLLHEVGHHVDNYLGGITSKKEWQAVYKDPAARASGGDYGASKDSELFAETFKEYVNSAQSREAMDPRVRAFMDRYISPLLPTTPEEHPRKTRGLAQKIAKEAVRRYFQVLKVYRRVGADTREIDKALRTN